MLNKMRIRNWIIQTFGYHVTMEWWNISGFPKWQTMYKINTNEYFICVYVLTFAKNNMQFNSLVPVPFRSLFLLTCINFNTNMDW